MANTSHFIMWKTRLRKDEFPNTHVEDMDFEGSRHGQGPKSSLQSLKVPYKASSTLQAFQIDSRLHILHSQQQITPLQDTYDISFDKS